MRFRFKSNKLEALYTTEKGARKYPPGVVDAFFEVMAAIDAAKDERDLHTLKGLNYEKLKGQRRGERSLRLNKQYRLVVREEKDEKGKFLVIVDIDDYH